jgi:hypothetical protein
MVTIENEDLGRHDRVVYGTDLPMTQTNWIQLQVSGLKAHGRSAGFFRAPMWFLYSLSFFITAVVNFFRLKNPLPRSRVESMSYSYIVNMGAPEGLKNNRSSAELALEVHQDLAERLCE